MKLKDPMQESCVVYSCMAQVQVKVIYNEEEQR